MAEANEQIVKSVEQIELEKLDSTEELLQTAYWARFKERFGWKARAFYCLSNLEEFYLLVLSRNLGPGFGLAYVPHGPLLSRPVREKPEFLAALGEALKPFLPAKTTFIRFDLPWEQPAASGRPEAWRPTCRCGHGGPSRRPAPLSCTSGLRKAPVDIQPPSTVLIDLKQDEDTILAGMKSKTRYNIRLSFKKGVEVVEGGIEELKYWYGLYRETARRDRIVLHSYAYYKALFEPAAAGSGRSGPVPEIKLLLARAEGDLIAGIIVAFLGRRAWYLYGASSGRKRNLMPNHALQWRAIQWAEAHGCETYDLFGIPPADDPGHPMHGLYRFKTGFGGKILHYYGCYDLPLRPFRYRIYRAAETGRDLYYKKLRVLFRR